MTNFVKIVVPSKVYVAYSQPMVVVLVSVVPSVTKYTVAPVATIMTTVPKIRGTQPNNSALQLGGFACRCFDNNFK